MKSEAVKFKKSFYNKIMKQSSVDNSDLEVILLCPKKNLITEFLFQFPAFTEENFSLIEKFINNNLLNKNRLFVSDLIDSATDFNLDLDYKICLSFLNKYRNDNHYVLISTIEYLCSNLKMAHIKTIVSSLEKIKSVKNSDDVAKVFSLFYLYRITFKNKYLIELEQYLLDKDLNLLLLNLVNKENNHLDYFEGNALINEMIVGRTGGSVSD
jgi:hypothetical protein